MSRLSPAQSVEEDDDRALYSELEAATAKRKAAQARRRAEEEEAAREYARVYREQYQRRIGSSIRAHPQEAPLRDPGLSLIAELSDPGGGQAYELSRWGLPVKSKSGLMGNKAMGMGMGFAMGMFVGASVGLLHGFSPLLRRQPIREPIKNIIKRSVAGGSAFGVIFAMGSLFQ